MLTQSGGVPISADRKARRSKLKTPHKGKGAHACADTPPGAVTDMKITAGGRVGAADAMALSPAEISTSAELQEENKLLHCSVRCSPRLLQLPSDNSGVFSTHPHGPHCDVVYADFLVNASP